MLKKISVHDARIGMYIDELCGKWIDHPFWKSAFLLTEQKDLDSLQTCGIEEVWIDTAKGRDVDPAIPVLHEEDTVELKEEVADKKADRHVPLQEETQIAKRVRARAKRAATVLFHEARMGSALHINEVATLVDDIELSVARNSGALLSLARLRGKDDHTYMHSVAVCALMIALGKQLGMEGEQLRSLGMAGLLHDIGKTMIPEQLLNKPGKLTAQEEELVKTHPLLGWEKLKSDPEADEIVRDVCLHHHERMDGAGYPDGLKGEDISLHARMAAICDEYDAMTSDAPYQEGMEPAEAIHKMAEERGTRYDQELFHAFVKTVGIYPTGTLVKLKSGRLGVVVDQSRKSLLKPVVKVFFSTRSSEPIFPELIDLSKVPDTIVSVENAHEWKLDLSALAGV